MSDKQVPTVVIIGLETGKTTIPGVGCMPYAVCRRFPTVVRIRLSQPPAGLGLGLSLATVKQKDIAVVKLSLRVL